MKLFHKGLMFVAVLLTCELTLLGGLYALELRAESEAKLAIESRAIVAEGSNIIRILQDAAQSLSSYAFLRNPEALVQFESMRTKELPLSLKHLRQISLGYNQQDLQQLERIAQSTNTLMDYMEQSRELMGANHELGEMVKVRQLLNESVKARTDLNADLSDFVQRHRISTANQVDPERQSKTIIKNILIIGVGFNVVLAVAMVVIFSGSITSRLAIMSDNTRRVLQSLPLQPRLSGNDEIANLDKTFHDMSRALKEAAERERAVIDNMPVGFVTLFEGGTIESINPSTEALTGYTPEEIKGKSFLNLLAAPASFGTDADFQKIASLLIEHRRETVIARADGTTFHAELSAAKITSGGAARLVVNIMDITERHEAERLKREFVDMLSHDLRTPMSSIQMCLELLSRGDYGQLVERGRHTVEIAEREATRLMKLIADLLDMARTDSGAMEISTSRLRVGHLFSVCAAAVETPLEEKKIELLLDESDLLIEADEDRLVQVLVNFLANAIKFSPINGQIYLRVEKVDGQAEISVTDEGPGIPKDMQNAVFERFKQVSKEHRKKGTGLGLAICKMIVQAHGGTIGVRSEIGKGSTFWFAVPLAPAAPAQPSLQNVDGRSVNETIRS